MKIVRCLVLGMMLTACLVAKESTAAAQNSCPYDVTGNYSYDPEGTPSYHFFGDGKITYDNTYPVYMDDVRTCYNVHLAPAYLPYFLKCDIDGDGTVTLDEVYDIYHRVHPREGEDPIVQSACVEAFSAGEFVFCPPSRYARTFTDIHSIVAAYPATRAVLDFQTMRSRSHESKDYYDNLLRCKIRPPNSFPADIFESLDACYFGDTNMVTMGGWVYFTHPANLERIVQEYNEEAVAFGGSCILSPRGYQSGATLGFHPTVIESNPKWWSWEVRTTAQCHEYVEDCDCDMTYRLWTHRDSPGQVWLDSAENNSNFVCNDLHFGGTGCADSDWDSICDEDDVCDGEDDTIDWDNDGFPNCIDQCPTDQNRIEPGICGCNRLLTDKDGDGVLDCIDPCPDHNPDDPDDDGRCGDSSYTYEELCVFTGGTWEFDCGHWPCGMQPWTDCLAPGCRCGLGANFDAIRGCVNDPSCGDECGPQTYGPACGVDCRYDSDNDGTWDCDDRCPFAFWKVEPGSCGCNNLEGPNCTTGLCINDPNKIEPGVCGCGHADIDADYNGVPDCLD